MLAAAEAKRQELAEILERLQIEYEEKLKQSEELNEKVEYPKQDLLDSVYLSNISAVIFCLCSLYSVLGNNIVDEIGACKRFS